MEEENKKVMPPSEMEKIREQEAHETIARAQRAMLEEKDEVKIMWVLLPVGAGRWWQTAWPPFARHGFITWLGRLGVPVHPSPAAVLLGSLQEPDDPVCQVHGGAGPAGVWHGAWLKWQ